MSKGFLKKCVDNLKLIAPITLIGAIVFSIIGLIIWFVFNHLPLILAILITYIILTLLVTYIFTYFVYDNSNEVKEEKPKKKSKKKKNKNDEDDVVLPFMPRDED